MELGERPVIFLGQYGSILKHYIFTYKMWTHKVKIWIDLKEDKYVIVIQIFQSQQFGFWYPLTAPDIQTVDQYRTFRPKYVDTDAATTTLG